MRAAWATWVRMWDRREPATSMALVRICLGLVICGEFLNLLRLDLATPLFTLVPEGWGSTRGVWIYEILPSADAIAWTMAGLGLLFALGVATPLVAVLLVLLYAQTDVISPLTNRAIDRLLRNALVIMVFARAGHTLAVDARLRFGRWINAAPIPAWPRQLLIIQLVFVYTTAGFAKIGAAWLPPGGFSALYRVLSDPGTVAFTIPHLDTLYPLTQFATAATLLWECSAPIVLLAYWYRHTASRPGWLRRQFNRFKPDRWWLAIGVAFHLGIAIFLSLGIFSWGMLALYPAWVAPVAWHRFTRAAATP